MKEIKVPTELLDSTQNKLKGDVLAELEGGEHEILLNAEKTTRIDSAGVGMLSSLRNKIEQKGGKLVIRDPDGVIRETLSLCKRDLLFAFESEEGASTPT